MEQEIEKTEMTDLDVQLWSEVLRWDNNSPDENKIIELVVMGANVNSVNEHGESLLVGLSYRNHRPYKNKESIYDSLTALLTELGAK
jgi:hypothetical protein